MSLDLLVNKELRSASRTKINAAISAINSDVQPIDADLTALAALATTGHVVRTGSATYATRTITGTANEITITNGSGVSGNPTVSIPAALTLTGKTITGGTFVSMANLNTHTIPGGTGTIALTSDITTALSSYQTKAAKNETVWGFTNGGAADYTVAASDYNNLIPFTVSAPRNVTIPDGLGWTARSSVIIHNRTASTQNLTLVAGGATIISGSTTITPGSSAILVLQTGDTYIRIV